jgi:hypothetical protein
MSTRMLFSFLTIPLLLTLSACEVAADGTLQATTPAEMSSPTFEAISGLKPKWIKSLGNNCYKERFVQPPKGKNKNTRFRYLLAGPWAPYVDMNSLVLALNNKDIDYTLNAFDNEIHFTNPGKSKAVVDIEFCLAQTPPPDLGGGTSGGGSTTGSTGDGGTTTGGTTGDGGTTTGGTTGDDGSGGGDGAVDPGVTPVVGDEVPCPPGVCIAD